MGGIKRKIDNGADEVNEEELTEVSIRRKITFDSDSDSDQEVIFNTQAHKRKRMAKDLEELKVWFDNKITEKLVDVASKTQTQQLIDNISKNTERSLTL